MQIAIKKSYISYRKIYFYKCHLPRLLLFSDLFLQNVSDAKMFSDPSGVLARFAKMQRGPLPETEMMEAVFGRFKAVCRLM